MCRIEIQRGRGSTSFTLEGVLVGPWVRELDRCWREEASGGVGKTIVVNLAAVSFVDAGGRELLSRMRSQGTKLEAKGCLMKSIVQEIEARQSVGGVQPEVKL